MTGQSLRLHIDVLSAVIPRRSSLTAAELITMQMPNHALRGTRPRRTYCNPCVSRAGSLSLTR